MAKQEKTTGVTRYGLNWPQGYDDLAIELYAIKRGGSWTEAGTVCGNGLTFHHEAAQRLLWPEIDSHRWSRLILRELTRPNHKITSLMGAASSGKTHEAAKWVLVEYFADPQNTCVLVSSTDTRGLKMRVWSEITMLWQRAVERWPDVPGHMLESRIAITTDALEDGAYSDRTARDMRKGIFGIPCVQDQKFVGLAKYHGIKQKRMRLLGDELSMMGGSFLKSFANLNNNDDFQAVVCFNPNETTDPGGISAEPVDGWGSHMEPTKTDVWDTRFMNGRCINLVGTDSPNFDDPANPNRYKYLIGPRKIAENISAFGKDSVEYYTQCVGVMKVSLMSRRVLNRDMCRKFRALEDVVWKDTSRTFIYAVDASYGGDRCVGGWAQFGKDVDDNEVLAFGNPYIIPIRVTDDGVEAEDQIATRVKNDCEIMGIPAENMFHDSTGRGALGTALARIWSNKCNPVEFGGAPTPRPVSLDMFMRDPDTGERRLIRCDEHYDRFVTELWFSVRYAIESEQIRKLPTECMDEFCMRNWDLVKNKKSIEPKSTNSPNKPGMKERTGRSPDFADWASIIVEGARQRGFFITQLGSAKTEEGSDDYFDTEAREYREAIQNQLLKH